MEVILKKDVEKVGYKGELVSVKAGFGRNYLIPKGMAQLATASVKKMHEETLRQRSFKEDKIKAEAQKAADALKDMAIKVGVKVGEKGKIFGSVNKIQLIEALKKLGHDIDKNSITLKIDPIKETGTYEAEIDLHRDIKETIRFEVVEEA